MKNTLFIILSLLMAEIDVLAQGTWTRRTDFPGIMRYGAYSFSIDKTAYTGGGSDANNTYSDMWAFNTSTNTWTQKAQIPIGRSFASAFTIFDKGYVAAGMGQSELLQDLWEYNHSNNSWHAKAALPGLPRYGAAGFALGNKGYICCGNQGSANGPYANDLLEYNPLSDVWISRATFPGVARYGITHATFILNNKAYVGLGSRLAIQLEYFKDYYCFNPDSNSWVKIADYPGEGSGYPIAYGVCGYGYAGTGQAHGSATSTFWKYDPRTNAWTSSTPFPTGGRWAMTSCIIADKVFVGTGFDYNSYFRDWWEFNCGITTPVNETEDNEFLTLYPNPSTGKFDLVCKLPASFKISVRVLSTTGQLVYQKEIIKTGSEITVPLDLSALEKGTYLVEVISGDKTLLKKIVIN